MREAERLLIERGCPKLNLLVRSSNKEVIEFYGKLGYVQDDVVSLGRRLIHDETPSPQGGTPARQPVRSETNRAPATAASRRSP
jgi:hypothetical protein